jgi:hypothetical protein
MVHRCYRVVGIALVVLTLASLALVGGRTAATVGPSWWLLETPDSQVLYHLDARGDVTKHRRIRGTQPWFRVTGEHVPRGATPISQAEAKALLHD